MNCQYWSQRLVIIMANTYKTEAGRMIWWIISVPVKASLEQEVIPLGRNDRTTGLRRRLWRTEGKPSMSRSKRCRQGICRGAGVSCNILERHRRRSHNLEHGQLVRLKRSRYHTEGCEQDACCTCSNEPGFTATIWCGIIVGIV